MRPSRKHASSACCLADPVPDRIPCTPGQLDSVRELLPDRGELVQLRLCGEFALACRVQPAGYPEQVAHGFDVKGCVGGHCDRLHPGERSRHGHHHQEPGDSGTACSGGTGMYRPER